MALAVKIVTTFARRETTPAVILWEGVVAVENPDKIVPDGEFRAGYPETVIKGTMKLVNGRNGHFIGTPGRQGQDGKTWPHYELGPSLQRLILPVLEAAAAVDPSGEPEKAEAVAEVNTDDIPF